MANNNKMATWIRIGITTLGLMAVIIAAFVWVQADVKAVNTKTEVIKTNIAEIKTEGCLPSRDNGNSITKIQTQLKAIQTQQQTAFAEILKRLPE